MNKEEIAELVEFSEQINDLANEKGWWDELPTRGEYLLMEKRLMVISEIGEAIDHLRQPGFMLVTWTKPWEPGDPKPEGYMVELADTLIRLLDLAMQVAVCFHKDKEKARKSVERALRSALKAKPQLDLLHGEAVGLDVVTRALYRETEGGFAYFGYVRSAMKALVQLLRLCEGRNLLEVAKGKHAYNWTRERRHGGKTL